MLSFKVSNCPHCVTLRNLHSRKCSNIQKQFKWSISEVTPGYDWKPFKQDERSTKQITEITETVDGTSADM